MGVQMMKNILLYTLCVCATAIGLLAQNTAGRASITGTVLDASGAAIPGAKVVVENPSKGIRRELETTTAGNFSVPALVPASGYQVTISKEGFSKYEVKDIELNVGQQLTVAPTLAVGSTATNVEVAADAQLVESQKTDVSQTINSQMLLELPINGRRVDSFVAGTAGANFDGPFGLLTFRGNPGGNTFLTDGNDTTNQWYGENAGRTRTYNISQDAVQEFQVVSAGGSAEYGRASGGVVNTVTRSGSNNLHGTAYWFYTNDSLRATDPYNPGINPPEERHQAGASVGGPIKKNKLFYFFNGELQRRDQPISSSNITSSFFDIKGNYVPGPATNPNCGPATPVGSAVTATATQCTAAISYLNSRVAPQLVPRNSDVNLMFFKLDYQINDRNSLTSSLNYLDFRSPNGIQTQPSLTSGAGVGNNADTNVFDRTVKVGLTTVVKPNILNEARFGLFKDRQFDPASPSLLPSIGPIGLSIAALSNVGYATSYPRLNPSELRLSFADSLSWTVRNHAVKFGFEFANIQDFQKQLSNQFGSFTYANINDFARDFTNTDGGKRWQRYTQTFGNPVVDITLKEYSFYAQDQWRVTPKLTITPGIRYEWTDIPQPLQVNPAFPQTGVIPNNSGNWAPRIGVAYAWDTKTVFRAGYGLYFNRVPSSTIGSLFSTNGLYQQSFLLNGTTALQLAGGPVFPNRIATPPNGVAGTASVAFADKDFRNAYSQQLDVAIERELRKNLSLTLSYIWSRGLHIISGRDINAAAPTTTYTYSILDRSNAQVGSYTAPIYTSRVNPAFGQVTLVDSSNNSYYNAGIVQLNQKFNKWFQGQASYTWSHAIDYNVGGGGNAIFTPGISSVINGNYAGERDSSTTDQRHRLSINAIMQPKFTNRNSMLARNLVNGWQLSIISTFASAVAAPATVNVTATPNAANGFATGVLNNGRLTGLGGPSRVPFEPVTQVPIDQIYRTDARITRTIMMRERLKIQLFLEAFNVFNKPLVSGASPRNFIKYNTTRLASGQIALTPNALFNAPLQGQLAGGENSARRTQLAIRISF